MQVGALDRSEEGTGHAVAAPLGAWSPGQRPRNPVGRRRGGPRPADPPPARLHLATDVTLGLLGGGADSARAAAQAGELEARDEPGTRAGRPEPGRGGSCADLPHSLPGAADPGRKSPGHGGWRRGAGSQPRGPDADPGSGRRTARLFWWGRRLSSRDPAPGAPTGPAACSRSDQARRWRPDTVAAPGRLTGPPSARAAVPHSRSPGSRSGPESRPDTSGLLPRTPRPGPTYSPRLRVLIRHSGPRLP